MRDIKVRSWRNKEMMFSEEMSWSEYWDLNDPSYEDDLIFMEYTGHKDKNGKDIYEGDILKLESYLNSDPEVVTYNNGDWCDEGFFSGFVFYTKPEEYTIIGNVYENPELLKHEDKQK